MLPYCCTHLSSRRQSQCIHGCMYTYAYVCMQASHTHTHTHTHMRTSARSYHVTTQAGCPALMVYMLIKIIIIYVNYMFLPCGTQHFEGCYHVICLSVLHIYSRGLHDRCIRTSPMQPCRVISLRTCASRAKARNAANTCTCAKIVQITKMGAILVSRVSVQILGIDGFPLYTKAWMIRQEYVPSRHIGLQSDPRDVSCGTHTQIECF